MYANTRFKTGVNEWGRATGWIEPGDEVSQKDLDVSDEEWQSLIDAGAVVEEYPKDLDPSISPREAKMTQSPELTELPPHASPSPNPPAEDTGKKEADKQPWEK